MAAAPSAPPPLSRLTLLTAGTLTWSGVRGAPVSRASVWSRMGSASSSFRAPAARLLRDAAPIFLSRDVVAKHLAPDAANARPIRLRGAGTERHATVRRQCTVAKAWRVQPGRPLQTPSGRMCGAGAASASAWASSAAYSSTSERTVSAAWSKQPPSMYCVPPGRQPCHQCEGRAKAGVIAGAATVMARAGKRRMQAVSG
jgi:hypothetical protein